MTTSQILNDPKLAENIAGAVGYNEITGNESLMVQIKSGDFKMVEQNKVGYMVANQGWIECVSSYNMVTILGIGNTSDEGTIEGEKIAAWMRAQK